MAFDMNNFVIDRVVRGVALSQTDDSVMFALNQITNPSLSCSSESTDAVDALGVPIATFYRAKNAEFSAENAIYDMNLMATQVGSAKQVASDSEKIVTPAFETIDIDGSATYTLKHVPLEEIKNVYALNGDGSIKYNQWVKTNNKWYYVNDQGLMIKNGIYKVGTTDVTFDENGVANI